MFVEKVTLLKKSLLKSKCKPSVHKKGKCAEVYTCAVLGWASFVTDLCSLTSSLRIRQAIATLLDSMRESIIA